MKPLTFHRAISIALPIGLALLSIQATAHAERGRRAPIEQSSSHAESTTPEATPEVPTQSRQDFKLYPIPKLSGRIAFSAKVGSRDQIFELDLDSKAVRAIIEGPGNSTSPDWSPNGKGLVFVSDRDGNKELYLSDFDGQSAFPLTKNPGKDYDPSWTSDGRRVIFSRETPGSNGKSSQVISLDVKSGEMETLISQAGLNSTAQLSPDGQTLAFATNSHWPGWDICFLRLNEKDPKSKLTCPLNGATSYFRPAWAPSGTGIAYSAGDLSTIDLQIFNLADQSRTYLTEMENREYDATWSPDGSSIAFVAEGDISDKFSIYLIDLQSKKPALLLSSDYSIRSLSWSKVTTLELEAQRFKRIDPISAPAAQAQ